MRRPTPTPELIEALAECVRAQREYERADAEARDAARRVRAEPHERRLAAFRRACALGASLRQIEDALDEADERLDHSRIHRLLRS